MSRPAAGPTPSGARLGFGLAAVGRPAYINLGRAGDLPADRSVAALQDRAHQLLHAAWAVGCSYFDVARSYGLAEQFLYTWLQRTGAGPFVASKWGYRYTADWTADPEQHEVKDHSQAAFERQWSESQALLGPWLRLYQVHSLTSDSPLWGDQGLLRALARLRERGCQVGFSTSGPAQADAVRRGVELRMDGEPLFTSVQSTWNLLERSAGPALAEAAAAGARVVVKEALANGRLSRADTPENAALAEAAQARDVGPDTLAIAAVMAQPWVDVVLSGAVTASQLSSNARASEHAAQPGLETLVTPQDPAGYWAERSRLSWS